MRKLDLSAPEHVTRILNIAYTMRTAGRYLADFGRADRNGDVHIRGELEPYTGGMAQAMAEATMEYTSLLEELEGGPFTAEVRNPRNPSQIWYRSSVMMKEGAICIEAELEEPHSSS